jgi:nucleoside-diphosphate-sugar epimerase
MKEVGIKRFVGIGTLAEKDIMNYLTEDGAHPTDVSTYGIAKITAHYMMKTQCAKAGVEYIWCCLSNTYGVGNTTNNFVNMACKKMLNGERAAFTSGEQPYDFVYITDVAKALVIAGAQGKADTDYFIGSSQPRKLKDYIITIRDTIDPEIPLYLGEVPFLGIPLPPDALDAAKLTSDTGFKAGVPFETGIRDTVAWLKATQR